MALLWMDGFDTYGAHGNDVSSVISSAGYVSANGLSANNETRTGRGFCVQMASGAGGQQTYRCRRAFETVDEVIIGFAMMAPNVNLSTLCNLMYDDRFGQVYTQISVYKNAQSGITVAHGNGTGDSATFVAASAPNVLFAGVWHFVEVRYKPNTHTIVRVDGVTVLHAAGAKNPNAPELVNMMQFLSPNTEYSTTGGVKRFDDLYICDSTGVRFNDFCGDVVIHAVLPAGDAGPNQWTGFGGGLNNFSAVQDVPPDGDTSYIFSNTLGHVDMFDVDPLPPNIIDVLAVSVHARAKKDAAGASKLKLLSRWNGMTQASPELSMTTQYSNKDWMFELAPDGGPWNRVKANEMKIGVEIA